MGSVLSNSPNNPIIRATSLGYLLTQSSKTQCTLCFPSSREMVQGRGSAMAATVLLCFLLLHFEFAQAATYTVGGSSGWTFNAAGWSKGKRFKAGDTLGKHIHYTSFLLSPIYSALYKLFSINDVGLQECWWTSCLASLKIMLYPRFSKGIMFVSSQSLLNN